MVNLTILINRSRVIKRITFINQLAQLSMPSCGLEGKPAVNHAIELLILNSQRLHGEGVQTNQLLQPFCLLFSHLRQSHSQGVSELGAHFFQLFIFIKVLP